MKNRNSREWLFTNFYNYLVVGILISFFVGCTAESDKKNQKSGDSLAPGPEVSGVVTDSLQITREIKTPGDLAGLTRSGNPADPATSIKVEDVKKLAGELANSPEYYSQMGNSLCAQGKFGEGIQAFTKAIELEPSNLNHMKERGRAKLRTGDYQGALQDLTRSASLNNSDTSQLMAYALANYFTGNYQKALDNFNAVVRKNPNMPGAVYNRGLAYAQLNRLQEAIDDFTKTLEQSPGHHMALFNRGLAYLMLGNNQKACEDWQNAKKYGSLNADAALKEYCK